MPELRRIVFVDDEPRILHGLSRMLRSMRDQWEAVCLDSAQEALNILADRGADAVVSDMRMPVMTGVDLFKEMRASYPGIVRIALSGQMSQATVLGSIGLVHRYLAKPSEAELIRSALSDVFALESLVEDQPIRDRLVGIGSVPSVPAALEQLTNELQGPEPSGKKTAAMIAGDLGLSLRIMQLVSSAFLCSPAHVTSPAEAAGSLGVDMLNRIVRSEDAVRRFSPEALQAGGVESVQRHSIMVARCAQAIAQAENAPKEAVDHAFVGGLFHDIGKLVVASEFTEEVASISSKGSPEGIAQIEAEREVLGVTHAQAGAYLLGLWGLHRPVVEAAKMHHCPSEGTATDSVTLAAVHVANAMEHRHAAGPDADGSAEMDQSWLAQMGLDGKVSHWQAICRETMEKELANV